MSINVGKLGVSEGAVDRNIVGLIGYKTGVAVLEK